MSLSWTSRLRIGSLLPSLTRTVVNRAAIRPIPAPRGTPLSPPLPPRPVLDLLTPRLNLPESIATPNDFLKAIGRSSETKMSVEGWEDFWKTSGYEMRKSGLSVRDRRYILWCMEKYRNGIPIKDFAHEPKPKKKIRGWGPAVQNGKRIRSRRWKNKK